MENEKAYPYIKGGIVEKLLQILNNNIYCFENEIKHLQGKLEEAQNIKGQIEYMIREVK